MQRHEEVISLIFLCEGNLDLYLPAAKRLGHGLVYVHVVQTLAFLALVLKIWSVGGSFWSVNDCQLIYDFRRSRVVH